MTVKQTAKKLNRSPWYIRQLCNLGKLPAYKVGGYKWEIPYYIVDSFKRDLERRVPNF